MDLYSKTGLLFVLLAACACLLQRFVYLLLFNLRNPYAGQEATLRTGHGTTDWFQIGKGVRQGCILSPRKNANEEFHTSPYTTSSHSL